MGERVTVCKLSDVPADEGKTVLARGKLIAVFRDGERLFALDDACPHMGASLAGGHVEGGVVTCPWHAWRFRLCDGAWADSPRVKTGWYAVHIDGDAVQVELPTPKEPQP